MNFDTYKQVFNINNPQYEKKMEKLHSLYYPQENKLSKSQEHALKEILEHAKLIAEAILPLSSLGIKFDFGIVGGAVRDLVLDKTDLINDYDFVIRLEDSYKIKTDLEDKLDPSNLSNILTSYESGFFYAQIVEMEDYCRENQFKKELSSPYYSNPQSMIEKEAKIKLLLQMLVDRQLKKKSYQYNLFRNKDVENKYLNQHIDSIFQINNLGNKKVDLILSKYNEKFFSMTFDFEICKAAIGLNFLLDDKISNEDYLKEMINNIWLTPGMLRDVDEKTMTIRIDNFDENHIHYFMNKHYLKLKEKFPDYSINAFTVQNNEDSMNKTNVINSYKVKEAYKDLQAELAMQDNQLAKKIKI